MSGIEFDPEKSRANHIKHGLDLEDFRGFDSDPLVIADERNSYGEPRYRAYGRIDGLPYMIAYTIRGSNVRLISFRRAHEKELRRHERAQSDRS